MAKPIAIIPARGGSKRIPRKNIRLFAGKPMIAYSIEAARESGLFERVIVSTDSEEIADIARKYGAEVPFMRSAELASDCARNADVVIDALEQLNYKENNIEIICYIYATAPFLSKEYLIKGYEAFKKSSAMMTFSATAFSYPILRSFKIKESGEAEMFWPEYLRSRSQDMPEAYHDAGQFYWLRTKDFTEKRLFIFDGSIPVVLPEYLVQDVDTPDDWEYAEIKYKIIKASSTL